MTKQLQSDLAKLRETIKSHLWESIDFQNHRHLQHTYQRHANILNEVYRLCSNGDFKEAFLCASGMKEQIPQGLWGRMERA
jgi:hypothetical protein